MTEMDDTTNEKVVLFDLDNTLFDHHHSLRSAIAAVQKRYTKLAGKNQEDLITKYNEALQQAYDKYLSKEITYDDADTLKIQLFFKSLGLPQPSSEEAREFRDIYKPAYRENRRATPGSIEVLIRLRENGYRLAILSNGQSEDQTAKAEAIGIRHLVDRIYTSEEAGCAKPDPRIFQFAIDSLESSADKIYMVGDSIDGDIKGALDAEMSAILYSPTAHDSQRLLFGEEVPIIHHMDELLVYLGI